MNEKQRTIALGLSLLVFMTLAYVENMAFFNYFQNLFSIPLAAIAIVFMHNVLAISLILLSMSFYVQLVLTFFPKKKYEYIILEHPRVFALVFMVVILFISILRASMLVYGRVVVDLLGWIVLLSLPNGIVEGYGIYLTIKKTLSRELTMRDLILIYSLFFIAALIEVGYVHVLGAIMPRTA